jgi:alkane 1-monooxygenase
MSNDDGDDKGSVLMSAAVATPLPSGADAAPCTATDDPAPQPGPVAWRDPKRHLWLIALLVPMGSFIAWGLVHATGLGLFWFAGPIIIFGLFPLLDLWIGHDESNPPDAVVGWLGEDRYYRRVTYAYIPLQYAGLTFACWLWTRGGLSTVDRIGLLSTVSMVGGISIANAHELGHKRAGLERWLSKVALAQTAYGHFYIEHNRGHHVRVSTPEDPASARLGEGFWEFLPRTVAGSLISAWHLERERLARLGRSPWTMRNDLFNAWAMTAVAFGALVAVFGVGVLPYLVIQAVCGFSLLELVNYLEHYGLLRQRRDDGRYERTRPEHSWNSNSIASNVGLFHLQRHSDHHANPVRRYQVLRHADAAPQLPTGYAGMMVVAMVPAIWRRMMDGRVVEHYGGDVTRCNIHKRKRKRVLARHGAGSSTPAR